MTAETLACAYAIGRPWRRMDWQNRRRKTLVVAMPTPRGIILANHPYHG